MAVETFVAGTRLKVGDGFRHTGDLVPEAAGWKTLGAYLRTGQVVRAVFDDDEYEKRLAEIGLSPSAAEAAAAGEPDFGSMTVAELKAYADANGIEYPSKTKKAELVEIVRAG